MISAQVIAGAQYGGAELFFERLCGALHDAGEGVVPVIRRNAARAARLRNAGLHPHELRFGGPIDVVTRHRLRTLLQETRPGVVVAWMGRAAAAAPRGQWTLVGRLGGYYDLRRFRRCRHLVANTSAIADWIMGKGWPAERVHRLPNFVPDLLGAAPADRASLGVPVEAPLMLALGRLHPNKGYDVLIHALASLPQVHLIIAGDGDEHGALARLASQIGVAERLHLPGWRSDVGSLLATADVFVSSARREPLGNAVLDAWSAGRPVVATASEGPRTLIRDGEDGLLRPVDDAEALASAVAGLLDDRQRAAHLAAAGRERYRTEFGEAVVVGQWRDFMASVAA